MEHDSKYERITFRCDLYEDASSRIRIRELLGAEYFVLPSVMMVEGAYYPSIHSCNDRVALYFSADELLKSANSWNGRGISMMHPEGNSSFNVPDVFDNHWLGFVFNTGFEDDKKRLVSDLWISKDRGQEIVDRVQAREQIDLSIGACGNLTVGEGVANGIKYTRQFTNIVGDHLAILPDVKGACSWSDGCGIRASEYGVPIELVEESNYMPKAKVQSIAKEARKPSYDGTEEISWVSVGKTFSEYLKGYLKHKGGSAEGVISVATAPQKIKTWIASKTLLGDPNASSSRDLIFFPVVNPMTNKLSRGALRAVISGRGAQAEIPTTAKKTAIAKANLLLEEEFGKNKKEVSASKEPVPVAASDKGENMSEEIKRSSSEEIPLEDFIEKAPSKYRKFLLDAVLSTKARRDETIKAILDFKDVAFCSKFLEETGTSDLEAIMSTTRLVNKYKETISAKEAKDSELKAKEEKKDNGVVDFSVNSFADSGAKEKYMPIRKINFLE